ncbi:MAG: winged helix-turn-helix transcriptional regulator [bacterium]
MRKEEIQELKLMEEVHRNEGFATQRELAVRLNVSLGLVNAFIKRVVRKGYFKVTTIPGRRVRYLLTPQGLAEKSRKTVSYIRYSLSYYREIRLRLNSVASEMKAEGVESVALVGTGELAEMCYLSMREAGIEISVVVSPEGGGERFLGYQVESLEALKEGSFDAVCLMELDEVEKTLERLRELGIPPERIVASPSL